MLQGIALHAGVQTSVTLALCDGPTVIEQHGVIARLDELRVQRADRGVAVVDPTGRLRVDLIEHLMAAVGALGLERGVHISIEGPEAPLLDGGAKQLALGLRSTGARPCAPTRRIARRARFEVAGASFELEPSDRILLHVAVEYDHPLIQEKTAAWHGDAVDFVERIAAARTYGFLSEAQALRATARARGANTHDVIVLCDDGTSISDPLPLPDECVRHKLLDLIGDLTLGGGLPIGTIRALRPGHRATHEMLALAQQQGVFAPTPAIESEPCA
ncbi:MAG: UDP-3-O-acyl-N-acetylglucosamine deacetylase [Deltaproteobacteria bacterium]|nr:UDP-3-O-acyl-N-acetylglucosamine deacetylase [Deltaproteobacteria bacterium]